jgi:predicted ATPase
MGHRARLTERHNGKHLRSTKANAYAECGRTESRLIEMQSEEYLALAHRPNEPLRLNC